MWLHTTHTPRDTITRQQPARTRLTRPEEKRMTRGIGAPLQPHCTALHCINATYSPPPAETGWYTEGNKGSPVAILRCVTTAYRYVWQTQAMGPWPQRSCYRVGAFGNAHISIHAARPCVQQRPSALPAYLPRLPALLNVFGATACTAMHRCHLLLTGPDRVTAVRKRSPSMRLHTTMPASYLATSSRAPQVRSVHKYSIQTYMLAY